jgi:hypothetical protein
MILLPQGVKVHLAFGYTDMRNYAECMVMLSRRCGGRNYPRYSAVASSDQAGYTLSIILGPSRVPSWRQWEDRQCRTEGYDEARSAWMQEAWGCLWRSSPST